jgi:hypothetical protein
MVKRWILPLVAAAACAGGVYAATLKAAPATLEAQLRAARPGDVVMIDRKAPCGALTVQNLAWAAPGPTLDLTGATCGSLMLSGVQNLTVRGGTFTPSDWRGGVYVGAGASGVTLQGVSVTGTDGAWTGVMVRGARRVALERLALTGNRTQVSILSSSYVSLTGSRLTGQTGDGVNVTASDHVRIADNFIGMNVETPIHPDAVQMFSLGAASPISDVEVSGNLIIGPLQGINNFGNAVPMTRITVRDNLIITSYPQGVAFAWWQLSDSRLSNNRSYTLPGSKWQTMIREPTPKDPVSNTACGNAIDGRRLGKACER